MSVDWELLMGLVLPAYGAGYLWLTNVARNDPDLYLAIEFRLLASAIVALLFVVVVLLGVSLDEGIPVEVKREYQMLAFVFGVLAVYAISSRSFFREITRLPPKGSTRSATCRQPSEPAAPTRMSKNDDLPSQ
jgi:hypothetical protein